MIKKNKRGISPLIATVLVIGFTIVLAALVITWGTKLFRTTVEETEAASKITLACTTGLKLDVLEKSESGSDVILKMRNNNQNTPVKDFLGVINFDDGTTSGSVTPTATDGNELEFPVPKVYTFASGGTGNSVSIDVYPEFDLDGQTKACENPIRVELE